MTLRLVFRLPLRQAEGFLRSVLSLMGVDLAAPDHTTLSRRSQSLAVEFRRIPSRGPIHLIVDSTGLSIVGEGEWAAVKHGGRGHRGWKTLHLAVDRVGVIVAHALTEPTVDAATIGIDLIETVDDEIARVTADAAYETVAFYAAAEMRDATVVVPPSKTARVSRRRPRSRARDRTITDVRTLGRRRWKKEAGYPLQARVENAFFRYKSILGDRLRARRTYPSKEPRRGVPIPPRLNQDVEHIAVLVHSSPQVLLATVDRDEELVEVPCVAQAAAPQSKSSGVGPSERSTPVADGLIGDADAALGDEVFHISKAQAEPVSRPGELHPQPLVERYVSLSTHTAPIRRTTCRLTHGCVFIRISSWTVQLDTDKTTRRRPFAPSPLQRLHHYYERLRPSASHRYSGSCGVTT